MCDITKLKAGDMVRFACEGTAFVEKVTLTLFETWPIGLTFKGYDTKGMSYTKNGHYAVDYESTCPVDIAEVFSND